MSDDLNNTNCYNNFLFSNLGNFTTNIESNLEEMEKLMLGHWGHSEIDFSDLQKNHNINFSHIEDLDNFLVAPKQIEKTKNPQEHKFLIPHTEKRESKSKSGKNNNEPLSFSPKMFETASTFSTNPKKQAEDWKYVQELMEASSFNKNMNDKKPNKTNPFLSIKDIKDKYCYDEGASNYNLSFNLGDLHINRKLSDDISFGSNINNYNINNINFVKKEMIFKTDKVRKYTSKSNECTNQSQSIETENNEENTSSVVGNKKIAKLIRNRISAKRSRAKKKVYIKELEGVLQKTYDELEHFKNLSKCNSLFEQSMSDMKKKETEFTELITQQEQNYLLDLKQRQIKQEYSQLQCTVLIELFKRIVKNIIPLEFKFFEKSILKLNDVINFETMDVLLERIIQNQILLEEASGKFQGVAAKNTISLPIKLFLFFRTSETTSD